MSCQSVAILCFDGEYKNISVFVFFIRAIFDSCDAFHTCKKTPDNYFKKGKDKSMVLVSLAHMAKSL